jgi:peptidoglycan/LPS O-acetylase OafA/YrhL
MTLATFASIERKRNYLALDGMRGVAALAVVSRHFTREMVPIALPSSYLAVDIFFAMSGFVLAHSYDARLGFDLSTAEFVKKRLVRLYPLYLASILIVAFGVAAALTAHIPVNWQPASLTASVVLSLLFLPTPPMLNNTPLLFPLNMPSWSLFMEIAVNIVYALVRPVLSFRALNWTLIVSALALVLAITANGNADIGSEWATLALSPPRVIFSFFLGVAIYRWDRADKLPHVPLPAWAVLLLLILLFAVSLDGLGRTVFDIAAVFVLLPVLLIAGIQNQPTRFKSVFTFLGVTSYPIYALHVPLQKYIGNGIDKIFGGDVTAHAPWIGLVILIVMLPIGWLADRFYDAPVRQMLGRALGRKRGRLKEA